MDVLAAHLSLAPMIAEFAQECADVGITKYHGVADDPSGYVQRLVERSQWTESLADGRLPSTTYFAVRDDRIVGAIRVRRGSTPNVDNVIGQIGYETRPSARGQGIATQLLQWVRQHVIAEPVMVSCQVGNPASQRVIENSGGVYIGNYIDEHEGEVKRFTLTPVV